MARLHGPASAGDRREIAPRARGRRPATRSTDRILRFPAHLALGVRARSDVARPRSPRPSGRLTRHSRSPSTSSTPGSSCPGTPAAIGSIEARRPRLGRSLSPRSSHDRRVDASRRPLARPARRRGSVRPGEPGSGAVRPWSSSRARRRKGEVLVAWSSARAGPGSAPPNSSDLDSGTFHCRVEEPDSATSPPASRGAPRPGRPGPRSAR